MQDRRTNNGVTFQTSRSQTGYETLLWSNIPIAQHEELTVTPNPKKSHVLDCCCLHFQSVRCICDVPGGRRLPQCNIVTGLQCQGSNSVRNISITQAHAIITLSIPSIALYKLRLRNLRDELEAQRERYDNPHSR